jgi:hypothetical protein
VYIPFLDLILGTTGVVICALSLWARGSRRNPLAARADHPSAGPRPRTHVSRPLALLRPLSHAPASARSIVHQAGPAQHGHMAQRSRLISYPGAPPSETYTTCTPATHPAVSFAIIRRHSLRLWVFVLAAVLLCDYIPHPVSRNLIWILCVPGHDYLPVSCFFPCFRTLFPRVLFATPCATLWTLLCFSYLAYFLILSFTIYTLLYFRVKAKQFTPPLYP